MTSETTSGSFRLADEAVRLLEDLQASRGSPFDTTTKIAFQAVLRQMAKLVSSPGEPDGGRYYLASLDPGKGKTEAACMFLKAWRSMGFQPQGGVLIAVSRLDEISGYIERSGLNDDEFAVLVGDGAPVGLRGRKDRKNAPVLFTTHEMIRRRCRAGSFQQASAFHYQDGPRSCRIWDESMLPATPEALRLDGIRSLLEPVRPLSSDAAEMLEALITEVSEVAPGNTVQLPTEWVLSGPTGSELEGRNRARWDTLVSWAGDDVRVIKTNRHGLELVGATDRLPDDFAPAIILDASGRVRHTYRLWEACGDRLVRLPSAPTDYRNLTLHHWDRAASRSTLEDPEERQDILQIAADLINADPEAKWLVIHHMARGQLDAAQDLRNLVTAEPDRVQFVHWGNHHGTNDYRDIDKVLVLGLWHLPQSVLHAQRIAVLGDPGAAVGTSGDLRAMQVGEHQHDLLQAICRASVRNGHDGVCGKCDAYVIGRTGGDTRQALAETFPGAVIRDWRPLEVPLRGQAKVVAETLSELFTNPAVNSVRKAAVREAAGIRSSQGLAQVLQRADVRRWLEDHGLTTSCREVLRMVA